MQLVSWRLLTNHGRALLCLAHHPELRIRDLAGVLGITERSAQKIVGDLVKDGYVTRTRVGRRNTYKINVEAPMLFDRELTLRHIIETFSSPAEHGGESPGGPAVTLA